jgi:hypothetical protein
MMQIVQQIRKEGRNTERGHQRKVQLEEESNISKKWKKNGCWLEQRENYEIESSLHDNKCKESEFTQDRAQCRSIRNRM